jgi:hypothetical protein
MYAKKDMVFDFGKIKMWNVVNGTKVLQNEAFIRIKSR